MNAFSLTYSRRRSAASRALPALLGALLLASFEAAGEPEAELGERESAPVLLVQASDGAARESGDAGDAWAGPASRFGAYLSARSAIAARDVAAASDFLLAVLDSDPENAALLRQAHFVLVSAGRFPEALAIARTLAAAGEDDSFSPLTLAVDALAAADYGRVGEALSGFPPTNANRFAASMLEAWAKAGQGLHDEALAAIGYVDGETGDGDEYRAYAAALIEDMAGNADRAERAFAQVMSPGTWPFLKAPFTDAVVRSYGAFLERQGQLDKAGDLYRDARTPGSDALWLDHALARVEGGGAAPPKEDAAAGAALPIFAVAGTVHGDVGREPALVMARLAARLAPQDGMIALLVGDILADRGRHGDAVDVYRGVDPQSPFGWSAGLRAAGSLNGDGQTERAITLLRSLADAREDRADALILLGDILRFEERWPEAVEAYDAAFRRMGAAAEDHWRLRYVRGIALERSNEWERAESEFIAALEIRPEDPFILNYLGYSWVDRGEHLHRALAMIVRAVEQEPEDGYIIDSLGWAYYRLARFEDAVVHLERAVERRPADPVINDHLGDAYWKVGRHGEARLQWRRALSLADDDDNLVGSIETKLRTGLDASDI